MKKSKNRIIYIPGLFSLILILPLLLFYLNCQEVLKEKSVIEINSLSPEFAKEIVNDTSNYYYGLDPDRPFPKRNYKNYFITGQEQKDLDAFKQAHLDIKRLQIANDTVNGIYFHFTKNAKYWSFIKALDIIKGENIKRYLYLKNEIWVYNIPEPVNKEITYITCGTSMVLDRQISGEFINSLQVDLDFLIKHFRDLWIIYVIFILVAYLNFKMIKKYFHQHCA